MKKACSFKIVLILLVLFSFVLTVFVVNGVYQNRQLFKAIEKNDITDVEKTINRGAWINLRRHLLYAPNVCSFNPTPLIEACKGGNPEIVELLLNEGADINKKDNFSDKTPLLAALHGTKENRFSLAKYIIEQGGDIYAVQGKKSTLYETLYVSKNDSDKTIEEGFELFKYLLQQGVPLSVNNNSESVLTYAARYRNYNVVKYLIENEYFDVDSRDPSGDTALITAVKYEHVSIVELLLNLGADQSLTDNSGKTAMDYASACKNTEIIEILTGK